jgi:hypothetical protein
MLNKGEFFIRPNIAKILSLGLLAKCPFNTFKRCYKSITIFNLRL